MPYSRAEFFSSAGRHELSSQARDLLDGTFSSLNGKSSGRQLYVDDRGLIEANGKVYLLVDYLYQEKIAPDNYYYTTERQGKIFELTFDANSSKYNAKIAYSDQWKMTWLPDGKGGSYPSSLEDSSRGLGKSQEGQPYIYGNDGVITYITVGENSERNAIESVLNRHSLSTSYKQGAKDGQVAGVVSSSQHGNVIGFSTWSGGDSYGNIVWPEFDIVLEKSGANSSRTLYTFPKSQKSYPSDLIISQEGDIYAVYAGFGVPTGWDPVAYDAYHKVINQQKLTKIDREGNVYTVDLPGFNKQLIPPEGQFTYYSYDLTQGAGKAIWLIESKITAKPDTVEGRAWKVEDILKNKNATAQYNFAFAIPPELSLQYGVGTINKNNTYGLGEIGPNSSILLFSSNSNSGSWANGIYDKFAGFFQAIFQGDSPAASTPTVNISGNKSLTLRNNYDVDSLTRVLLGNAHQIGSKVTISGYTLSISSSSWVATIDINYCAKSVASGEKLDARQIDFRSTTPAGSILQGGIGNDQLWGKAGWDILDGGAGNDLIRAGNGRDIITGGLGADELHGDFGWNTFKSEQDGFSDLIAIKSDELLVNWLYGKAGNNPKGDKADIIEGLDANDQIKIIGCHTSEISVRSAATAHGLSGIGIYAGGALEALYIGSNLSVPQITAMTTGDGSTVAMTNQISSYGWTGA